MTQFGSKIKWEDANFLWNDNPYTWNEVRVIIEVAKGGGSLVEKYERLDEEDKKVFIEVMVKVKGNMEYSSSHIYNEKKEVHDNIKVTAEDVQLVIKEVVGINLEIDNIHV
mgnify:CR=1 FL=1